MKIFKLVYYEIVKIFRNPATILLMITLPIIIAYLGSSFFPDNLMGDYRIGVYNEDRSIPGRVGFLFIKQFFKWENAFEIRNENQLYEILESGDYDSILIVPRGFMNDVAYFRQSKLNLIPNPNKLQDSMAIYTIVDVVFRELAGLPEMSAGATQDFLSGGGITVSDTRNAPIIELLIPEPKTNTLRPSEAQSMHFKDIFAPSIVVIMILLFSMVGIGNSISHTRESGLFDIYRSNGLKIYEFISFKFISYFILGLLSSFIAWYIYRYFGVISYAKEWELIIMIIISVFTFTSLGVLISALTKTTKASFILLTSIMGTMILFGDILIPIPKDSIINNISVLFPIKYSVEAWRKMSILGFELSDVINEIYVLGLMGIIFLFLSLNFLYINERK